MLVLLRLSFLLSLLLLFCFYRYWDLHVAALAIWFVAGCLFLAANNSARPAFVQEVIPRDRYNLVNSLMEVEGQTATVFTGAAVALMLKDWSLDGIILCNALIVGISLLAVSAIRYRPSHLGGGIAAKRSVASDLRAGARYLVRRPASSALLLASFAPYACVMVGNYLIPTLLVSVLQAPIVEFAKYEMLFGVGAILAAFLLPVMIRRWGYVRAIVINMGLFSAVALFQSGAPSLLTVVWLAPLLGFGNAGIRVARNSWIMQIVETGMIGRVNSTLSSIALGFQALLTGVIGTVVVAYGADRALWVLFAVLASSTIVLLYCSSRLPATARRQPQVSS
jgi:predicted MFS family arabinose efflux permease